MFNMNWNEMRQWNWITIAEITICHLFYYQQSRLEFPESKQTKPNTTIKFTKNSNFHNSKSCRTFDEVKCTRIYNQSLITIMQKIAIVTNDPEYHKMPWKAVQSSIWAQLYYSDGYLRRKTEPSAAQSFSKRLAY